MLFGIRRLGECGGIGQGGEGGSDSGYKVDFLVKCQVSSKRKFWDIRAY
jgi:hypothetical protein